MCDLNVRSVFIGYNYRDITDTVCVLLLLKIEQMLIIKTSTILENVFFKTFQTLNQ